MFMLVCLPCCLLLSSLLLSGLLLSLASVLFRSCEDPFDYVCLSSSWTRSSSLWDFRQDDRYPGSHYYHCYASCFVLSQTGAIFVLLAFSKPCIRFRRSLYLFCLSSSWTRSSSLRDFRQDDHTLEITSIFACLVARSFAMPMLRYLPLVYQPPNMPWNSL